MPGKPCIIENVNASQTDTERCNIPPASSQATVIVKHSQSSVIPECPGNLKKLWDGYSFLNFEGNGKSNNQDLGVGGSCIPLFNVMPVISCDSNDVCNYATRSDNSYWLSTEALLPAMRTPLTGSNIGSLISRCVACESSSSTPIAVHSQTIDIPECPVGWTGLWAGYSFLSVRIKGIVLYILYINIVQLWL